MLRKLFLIVGMGLSVLLDMSMGMLVLILVSCVNNYYPPLWQYAIGAFLGVWPDAVAMVPFRKKGVETHGDFTHWPLLGLATTMLIGFLLGGIFWMTVAGLITFWHYLHDTEGLCLTFGLP